MKREFRVIVSSNFKNSIGVYVDETQGEIQLQMTRFGKFWFNKGEVEEITYTDGWEVGSRVSAQLDGSTVIGEIILVAPKYLKIRVTEGKYRNRELVRVPVDVSRASVVETTEYRLDFTHGKPNFRSRGNHICKTHDDVKIYLTENVVKNDMSDITLTKVTTRTELPKPVKVSVSFDF